MIKKGRGDGKASPKPKKRSSSPSSNPPPHPFKDIFLKNFRGNNSGYCSIMSVWNLAMTKMI
jgi:hypothetical protein